MASIQAVPHTGVPAELETYIRQVNDDFQRGSVLAPLQEERRHVQQPQRLQHWHRTVLLRLEDWRVSVMQ